MIRIHNKKRKGGERMTFKETKGIVILASIACEIVLACTIIGIPLAVLLYFVRHTAINSTSN